MELAGRLDGTDALAALDAAYDAAWEACDGELLALCRDRVGMLLQHSPTVDAMSQDRREILRGWPTSEQLTERDCAALAFTEQFVLDVSALNDVQAAALRDHLGDEGLVTFVNALLTLEQRMTLELAFDGVL